MNFSAIPSRGKAVVGLYKLFCFVTSVSRGTAGCIFLFHRFDLLAIWNSTGKRLVPFCCCLQEPNMTKFSIFLKIF